MASWSYDLWNLISLTNQYQYYYQFLEVLSLKIILLTYFQEFSRFGTEMVELAHLTGDRQNDLKDEKRR